MIETPTIRGHIEASIAHGPRKDVLELLEGADVWAISSEIAHLLTTLLELVHPSSVLEFGAGYSSLVLASSLDRSGGGRLTSVEHQPAFAEPRWNTLSRFRHVDAHLVHATLSLRFSRHGLLHEYSGIAPSLEKRGPFDFVFVDAPPGHLGRDATILAAAPFLSPGALIVLDDWARPAEQTTVRRWARALHLERVFESPTLGRGVSVVRVTTPGKPGFSLRTFAGTVHDRLTSG